MTPKYIENLLLENCGVTARDMSNHLSIGMEVRSVNRRLLKMVQIQKIVRRKEGRAYVYYSLKNLPKLK